MNALVTAKLQVMRQASYIQKKRTVGLAYSYAGMDAIIEKLRPEMIAAGLAICPVGYLIAANELFTTTKGSQMRHILVTATFRLTHAESGEFEDIVTLGESMDSGDKAANKAMTAAAKYAILQAFLLERGDDADPDSDGSSDYERAVAPAQKKAMTEVDYRDQLKAARTIDALSAAWEMTPNQFRPFCLIAKNQRKAELSAN